MPLPSLVPRDTVFFDLFNQAGQNIEETADFMVLYQIEAPMEQSIKMADVRVNRASSSPRRSSGSAGPRAVLDRDPPLENDGDRLYRDAVASLFANGIDPMVVIRWKDLFGVLERAVDATETAAHILEGIVIKNA